MSNLPRLLRSPLALVLLAFILLVILGSSSAPSYQIYKDASAKDIYNAMKDTLWRSSEPLGPELDLESFYHNRTSRWNDSYHSLSPPEALSSCTQYYFCKPIPELIAQPSPSTFQCPYFELNGSHPLVTIGVFSNAKGGKDEQYKRNLWRLTGKEGIPYYLRHLVDIRFVLGRSDNEQYEKDLDEEEEIYEDLIRLGGLVHGDNIDDGKTYYYFRHVYEETKHDPRRRPVFVMKTDLDSFLVLPNILDDLYSFSPICAKENASAYWGTNWGSWSGPVVPFYFRGLGYIISYPLLAWIASTPKPLLHTNIRNAEDTRTGAFLWWLPDGHKVWMKDEVAAAQDWNSNTVVFSTEVSIVHALKSYNLWAEYVSFIRLLWDKAGREYMWNPQPWHLKVLNSSGST